MILESIFLTLLGLFIGAFGTMVGVGGGFIMVPFLLFVYGASPQAAVGTSLTVIVLNALSGSISYAKQKRIDFRSGIYFGISTIPGSILGASILNYVPAAGFDVGFAIFLIAVAAYMTFRPPMKTGNQEIQTFDPGSQHPYSLPLGMTVSFFVGFLSSMAGIGGGIVHVPAMMYLFHFPPFIAVATSHFILIISTAVGSSSHAIMGHVLWDKVPTLGLGVIIGAQVGARLSKKINSKFILRGLSVAIVIAAIKLILKHL